jgi:hypothetical protein
MQVSQFVPLYPVAQAEQVEPEKPKAQAEQLIPFEQALQWTPMVVQEVQTPALK